MKPSITDWVQAIAVTVAVVFATWEFVLHDRAQDRLKKEAVLQLIVSGQNESISKSGQQIQTVFNQLRKKQEVSREEWVNLQTLYFPIQAHLSAWGFCYHNNMCDAKLTESYICDNLVDFDQFRGYVNKQVNNPDFTREKGYAALLKVCQAKVP